MLKRKRLDLTFKVKDIVEKELLINHSIIRICIPLPRPAFEFTSQTGIPFVFPSSRCVFPVLIWCMILQFVQRMYRMLPSPNLFSLTQLCKDKLFPHSMHAFICLDKRPSSTMRLLGNLLFFKMFYFSLFIDVIHFFSV